MTTRVLHVIARMNVGGTARYINELITNIPESKLVTGRVQGSEVEDPCVKNLAIISVRHLGRKISPINDFMAWQELRRIIRKEEPEIVHTHTFKAGLIGRLVGGKHKRVHTFHGHLFGDGSFTLFEKGLITLVEKILSRRTDLCISVGKKVGVELRSQGIGFNKVWESIPPGVKSLPSHNKQEARELLGIRWDGVVFGWLARMAEVKNPSLLLEIARNLPSVRFVMAGGGNLLATVKAEAPENVLVLGWVDPSLFWAAVDCAISTSDNEGMPIALIEAQLSQIPVIAPDVGSTTEVFEAGVSGIVVNRDALSFAKAIESLSNDAIKRHKMGLAGQIFAKSCFSINNMIKKHESVYNKILLE